MEQIDPKDLFYQILDGLRSLTHYDHSSALFIRDESDRALRLVAEQIAWKKAREPSESGSGFRWLARPTAMLMSGSVYGFDRRRRALAGWEDSRRPDLPTLLDDNGQDARDGDTVREDVDAVRTTGDS